MRILFIGAHQDDIEWFGSGLASMYAKLGHDVRFLSLCNGCGGHHIMTSGQTVIRRAQESAKVAAFLNVEYHIWDIDDCNLVADLKTRKRLIRYIREYNPDMIVTHRPNDYHADHRAAGQLVMDASYLLTVPHECADVPAMRFMPVIMYFEDRFKSPPFTADIVIDIDGQIETKLKVLDINESQVYEWLPYTYGEEEGVPKDKKERFEWLKAMIMPGQLSDDELMKPKNGYAAEFVFYAARFRKELTERYGEERANKIKFAEAFEVCEYGRQLTEKEKKEFFPF